MADQKISQLTTKSTPTTSDVLPIVDASAGDNKKVTMGTLPISTPVQTALNAKQDSLGYTAENVANKSTSVVTDQASNTKYPSVKAVYDWAVGAFQAALGFTPENVANKEVTALDSSTTKYPANKVVKDAVDLKANLAGGNIFSGTQNFGNGTVTRFLGQVEIITSFPYDLSTASSGNILVFNTSTAEDAELRASGDIGLNVTWVNIGTGQITFVPASGATLLNSNGHTKTKGQYSMGSLVVIENVGGSSAVYVLAGETDA